MPGVLYSSWGCGVRPDLATEQAEVRVWCLVLKYELHSHQMRKKTPNLECVHTKGEKGSELGGFV